MTTLTKPNAFVFKSLVDGEYRLCVCPRIDNKWSEEDIIYIHEDLYKEFDDVLDNKLFSIVFVGYIKEENGNGLTLKSINPYYLKSDTEISEEMYNSGDFFSTIEDGYQRFYETTIPGL